MLNSGSSHLGPTYAMLNRAQDLGLSEELKLFRVFVELAKFINEVQYFHLAANPARMEDEDGTPPQTKKRRLSKGGEKSNSEVAANVKVIYNSFGRLLHYSSNNHFRQQMMKKLKVKSSRKFSEKLSDKLIELTRCVHQVSIDKEFLYDSNRVESSDEEWRDEERPTETTQRTLVDSLESRSEDTLQASSSKDADLTPELALDNIEEWLTEE
ncbi:hypothetical protein CHUAL_004327 [Chamberlinius hualienensis]